MNRSEEINQFFYSNLLVILAIAILIIVIFALAYFVWTRLSGFLSERNYIKMEIQRTDGQEREYWKSKLVLFYLDSFPLIGGILCRMYLRRK